MKEYSIRVTPAHGGDDMWGEYVDRLWVKFLPKCLLATIEGGEGSVKKHIHMYIEADCTDGQIRYAIQTGFRVGKGEYSVKDPNAGTGTTSKCLAYICKGEGSTRPPNVLRKYGVDDAQVAEWHRVYHQVSAQVANGTYVKKSVYESLCAFIGKRQGLSGEAVVDMCMEWYASVDRRVHWVSFRDAVRKIAASQDGDVVKNLRDRLLQEIFS